MIEEKNVEFVEVEIVPIYAINIKRVREPLNNRQQQIK
jgi:hypothetical protein